MNSLTEATFHVYDHDANLIVKSLQAFPDRKVAKSNCTISLNLWSSKLGLKLGIPISFQHSGKSSS